MESDLMPKVSISVLTYNRSNLLKNLLLSLKGLKYEPLEIIVVDNHSEDNTKQLIKNEFHFVRYIRTEKNIGATARNLGMKKATGDIIITLDDDVGGINDDAIKKLVNCFINRPKLGAINFKILNHITGNICNWPHHCVPEEYCDKEFLTYEITEGAVAFNNKALKKAGYYPENFFLSHEGPDLAYRLINNGYEVIYSNIVSVIHKHSKLGRKGWLNYYYDTRNQLWLAVRNFPLLYAIIYLFRGLSSMLIYSVRDGFLYYWYKGIKDGIFGIKDALKNRTVLSKDTMRIIKSIDKNMPNLLYLINKRLRKKGIRL